MRLRNILKKPLPLYSIGKEKQGREGGRKEGRKRGREGERERGREGRREGGWEAGSRNKII